MNKLGYKENLKKALKDKEDFLKQYPHMLNYQAEIDEILSRCPDTNSKMQALTIMIASKLNALSKIYKKAKEAVDTINEKATASKEIIDDASSEVDVLRDRLDKL